MNWVISPTARPIFSQCDQPCGGCPASFLNQPVFAEVLRGIESVTDAFGYQTMLAHYGYKPELEEERLESMLSGTSTA